MRVVATFHPPSSVVQSIKCRLNPADDLEYLVVAKTNRLEVYSLQAEGLHRECSTEIWGRVVALRALSVDVSAITIGTIYVHASELTHSRRICARHVSQF